MVANSRAKLKILARIIEAASGLPEGVRPFQLSDVKRDGTTVVRFRSTDSVAAVELTERVAKALTEWKYDFTQVDDVRLVVPLGAIPK